MPFCSAHPFVWKAPASSRLGGGRTSVAVPQSPVSLEGQGRPLTLSLPVSDFRRMALLGQLSTQAQAPWAAWPSGRPKPRAFPWRLEAQALCTRTVPVPAVHCFRPARRSDRLSCLSPCLAPRTLLPRCKPWRGALRPRCMEFTAFHSVFAFYEREAVLSQNVKWLEQLWGAELLICRHLPPV